MTVNTPPSLPSAIASIHPDVWTLPFWEAARDHRLVAPQCVACGAFRLPPAPFCWRCRTQDVSWVELSGRGTVYTYTVTRQALIPLLQDAVPYVAAVIELEGAPGVRLASNIVDVDPDSVHVGMTVALAWDDLDNGVTLPRFLPVREG
jgi:uncharacterized OB-fold protein